MNALAAHPVASGHLGHTHPVEDIDHRSIALFHGFELHQHGRPPSVPSTTASTAKKVASATWWTSQARSVKQVPESVSPGYRNRAGECQAGAGSTPSSMNRNFTALADRPCWDTSWDGVSLVRRHERENASELGQRVGLAGIEPATSALSVLRSNRLSYSPWVNRPWSIYSS